MKALDWVKIESSNIDSVAYVTDDLYVRFNGGKEYIYTAVPQEKYDALMESESKGSFLNREIKNHFEVEAVDMAPVDC